MSNPLSKLTHHLSLNNTANDADESSTNSAHIIMYKYEGKACTMAAMKRARMETQKEMALHKT
ncbi:hypothetical protein PRLR5107_29380 [Prevotella lacticifex]|uniref:Uncharacterized protein n=1 Tax=Prevotella lacticifex TaxID=2854755 RepID=A0A9R1C8D4_9BACT|nr:hypothetical protein PRLR5003_28210 [Prevotella lacticifex]GJG40992.1 hypothetical protein PRLR5019_29630 [Prevotella lacticifex]GJG43538.1 hypothetical protein PRLR5025_23240 [Prevotella lacticifex]GJG47319.1 hypothetical protein PRLR5027_29140 [Prevotella lacticifex]GJG50029.1 hypothetical protein PRLR5052_24420 [Prevotella lacticifex]